MVLIMTNYFLCKLCIHTHLHTQHTLMLPNLGLHDYALRSLWPHVLSHVQSVLHWLGTTWHQSMFCSHQWGFSCKFTIKHFGVCTYCCFALLEIEIQVPKWYNATIWSLEEPCVAHLYNSRLLLPPCGDLDELHFKLNSTLNEKHEQVHISKHNFNNRF